MPIQPTDPVYIERIRQAYDPWDDIPVAPGVTVSPAFSGGHSSPTAWLVILNGSFDLDYSFRPDALRAAHKVAESVADIEAAITNGTTFSLNGGVMDKPAEILDYTLGELPVVRDDSKAEPKTSGAEVYQRYLAEHLERVQDLLDQKAAAAMAPR